MTINCLESTNLSAKKVNENESVTKPKDDAKLKAPLPLVNNIDTTQVGLDDIKLKEKDTVSISLPMDKRQHKKNVNYVAGLVNNGEADIGRIVKAGYIGLLGYILNNLDKDKQEKAISYFPDELLLKMCVDGRLPKYLMVRVFDRCTGENVNSSIAANIAKKAGARELKLLMSSTKNATAKQLYEDALKTRFSDVYEDFAAQKGSKDKVNIFKQKNFTLA